jgi:hypothetical protein
MPAGAEDRVAAFAELVSYAIYKLTLLDQRLERARARDASVRPAASEHARLAERPLTDGPCRASLD